MQFYPVIETDVCLFLESRLEISFLIICN